MTIYVLVWHNGLAFDDYAMTYLGYYSSEANRDAAEARYRVLAGRRDQWPFSGSGAGGKFDRFTVTLDEDMVVDMDAVLREAE